MKKYLSSLLAFVILAFAFPASAALLGVTNGGLLSPGFFQKIGSAIIAGVTGDTLGSSSNRWAEGWFTNLNATSLTVSGTATGNLDMGGNNISNAGSVTANYFIATSTTATSTFAGPVVFLKNQIQQFSGLTRTLTPAGGALVREYADTVALTTGNIEIGISYNCAVDPVTGVWAGRDTADICWLEKWGDTGGTKEFWYATTSSAGVVPTWTNVSYLDSVNTRLGMGTSTPNDTLNIATGGLTITGNSAFDAAKPGRIYKGAGTGLTIVGVSGTTYDMGLYTPTGTPYFENPHGTTNVVFNRAGGYFGVGTSTLAGPFTVGVSNTSALTDILVNPTTKTSGNFLDLQVGGTSKFSVNNNGGFIAQGASRASSFLGLSTSQSAQIGSDSISTANIFGATVGAGSTYSQTSGTNGILNISTTYNQASSTAANTDLQISRTETSVGSGAQNFINALANSVSKFSVSNTGLITSASSIIAGAGNQIAWTGRGVLTSPSAGVVNLGSIDVASPIAQTLSTVSVVAGTSNTAGQNWTFQGSRGTGTGAGGDIIFSAASASTTSGTVQNTATEVGRFTSTGFFQVGTSTASVRMAVQGVPGSTNDLFGVASSTGAFMFHIDQAGHMEAATTTPPTLSSCGGSPSIVGGDNWGTVTAGSAATACTVTFKAAYGATPSCVVTPQTGSVVNTFSYAVSTTGITVTETGLAGNKFDYHCGANE